MNRAKLMLLNVGVVFITTIVNVFLSLIEIRLFLSNYGANINGLIQTGNQVLNYLYLFEGGLCSAYMFHMYKPVADNDRNQLSAFYCGFKKNIQKVIIIMLAAAVVISTIYPIFINREGLSYLFTFSIFILLSAKFILPYQVTLVPKQMIILKEEKYKAELITGVTNSVIYIVEIIIVSFTDLPVQILLLLCICVSFISGTVFKVVMTKLYGNTLDYNANPDYSPSKMSKDVLPHTISGLIFGSTDNIVLSIFSSLRNVTIYSNYTFLSSHSISLSNKFIDGATATLGIKIANKDNNAFGVFKELFSAVLFVSVMATSVYIVMINDFISLWVGSEYCVSFLNVSLFGAILFCGLILPPLQSLVSASGTFKESKNFIMAQAALNLILTLILVPFLGITGALIGTVVARVFITVPFNYSLIYRKIFIGSQNKWYELIIAPLLIAVIYFLNSLLLSFVNSESFIFKTIISTLVAMIISFLYYYLFEKHFRMFMHRAFKLVRR